MPIFVALLIVLASVVFLFIKRQRSYWKDRGIKRASSPPRKERQDPTKLLQWVYKQKDDGPFIGMFMLMQPIVLATDLNFIQNILIKDFGYFHERGFYVNEINDPLSAHLFQLDGDRWKWLRAKLSPTFTSGKMKFMFPTIVEVGERFRAMIGPLIETENVLEMKDLTARFTTDVIGTCAFGIECNSLQNPNAEFRIYGNKIFKPNNRLKDLLAFSMPYVAKLIGLKMVPKDVTEFFMKIVRETVEYREANGIRRNDFMDLLIQLKASAADDASRGLSLSDIAAQCFIFFFAGFETSSTTMQFCLYELARNPDIQDRIRLEIEEVLDKHDGELTYEAIKEMTYLDWAISETLRKYPPAYFLFRRCVKNYPVPGSKLIIEKGMRVFIPVYSIHHDPEIYRNPDMFDPERFSPEQIKSRHPTSFLAFGDGPRNCIGLRFGKMQTQIGLIMLLRNYRFDVSSKTNIPVVFDRSPLLTIKGGMYLKVTKVK